MITESDLHRIVKNSVDKVLKESYDDYEFDAICDRPSPEEEEDRADREGMSSTYNELEQAKQILSDIANSGFIPFASPSPSSTEQELKDAIINASKLLEKSLYLCKQLGYK